MSIIAGKKVSSLTGYHVESKSAFRDAVIFFDLVNTAPTADDGVYGLYINSDENLVFTSGGVDTIIGAPGAAATTWEAIWAVDKTLVMSVSTWTLTQSSDVALLTLAKTGTGAGALIDLSNSGTGADIIGTGDTWQVSKTGLAQFATNSVIGGILKLGSGSAEGELTSNGAYDLVISTNSGTNSSEIQIIDAVNGDVDITLNGTGAVNINGTTTHNDALVVAAGDVAITLGSLIMADDQNAISFGLTNNTATTIGDVSSTAVVNLVSTSLTTGILLNLELTEDTLDGGYYARAWDATGAGAVWSVGENGVQVIGGAGGATSLTIAAGDAVMSDGSLAITDADDAATFTVTNNTATTASVVVLAGSGTFTGSTTSSWMTLTPSGLTSGTALYFPCDAMTTGKVIDINAAAQTDGVIVDILGGGSSATAQSLLMSLDYGAATLGTAVKITTTGAYTGAGLITITADAATTCGVSAGQGIIAVSADGLTTGVGLRIESLSNEVLTSGALIRLNHTADGTTVAAITGALLDLQSSVTEAGTSAQNYDVASFKRTSIHTTAGTLTASGSVLKLENVATQTTATLTDTVIGLEVVMDAQGTGAGIQVTHSAVTAAAIDIVAAATTTGKGLDISDGNALTTGILCHLASSATAITGAGRLFYSNHTGTTGTNAILNEFTSAATEETTVLRVAASSTLTGGVLLDLSASAMTTGVALDMSNLSSLTTGKGIHLDSTGTAQTSGILVHVDSAGTAITGAGRLLRVDHTGATTNSGILSEFASIANDETVILKVTASAALAAGVCLSVSAASMTTGTGLDIGNLDALTTGKGIDVVSNSADTTARDLIHVKNDNAAAVAAIPLHLENDAVVSTNFVIMIEFDGNTMFKSDGTTPNGNLTGVQGDLCIGGDSGKLYYCSTTGTTWTSL